ncbi:YaaL family protein [Levilactobacillus brevis]|uniref:YaaL family protein n=1 Tax=Levilactobacillus brevis TaxID=1580 RepID=UPI001BA9D9A5|nr:YaaL family protein [Levilactobacillus brevis]MBS1005330.1 YaaL family protein [Levilactobacillus brevis]MBS1012893.1 YaaL family protein [Levilactobacillus brevis]
MFGRKKRQLPRLKAAYDDQLLTAIDRAKDRWDHAKQTEEAIADADNQVTANTALTRQTYLFLYREARRRQVKGRYISAAVFRD